MQSSTACDLPIPIWIALVVLGFIVFWPLGLMIMFYLMWSGKMKCCSEKLASWKRNDFGCCGIGFDNIHTSGNVAFDEYREATLKRLDQERREFKEFMRKLRRAKDQDEFDKFMSERAERQPTASTSK